MSEKQTASSALEEAFLNKHTRRVKDGVIVRVVGPVVDVKFEGDVPSIYNALKVEDDTPVGHVSTVAVSCVPLPCRQPMASSATFVSLIPASP